jgi:hypothetical protein
MTAPHAHVIHWWPLLAKQPLPAACNVAHDDACCKPNVCLTSASLHALQSIDFRQGAVSEAGLVAESSGSQLGQRTNSNLTELNTMGASNQAPVFNGVRVSSRAG